VHSAHTFDTSSEYALKQICHGGMTNYPIGPHRTPPDPIGPQCMSFYRCTLHLGLYRRDS